MRSKIPMTEEIADPVGAARPLRVTRHKAHETEGPCIRIRCGCCDNEIKIHHVDDPSGDIHSDTLEINGVIGTIDQWRKILLPFLDLEIVEE